MNKKGFTLVEILAVIVVLSLIMLLTFPSIMKSFNDSKNKITELNKKQIEDAVKILIDEAIYCNMSNDTKNILGSNCNEAVNTLMSGKDIDVSRLGLDNNDKQKCTGTINVKIDRETYKETINMDNVECR